MKKQKNFVEENKWMNPFSVSKKKCSVVIAVAMLGMFTACGQTNGESLTVSPETVSVTAEPLLSETESDIRDYELKYSNGEFTMEDYHALAELYRTQGLVRKQRDMLEQSYRLYDDTEAFDSLQNISVNLAEEDEMVQDEAKQMLQNLQLEEYLDEGINQVSNDNWTDTMMPKLREGKRNYFLSQDGKILLIIQAGYNQEGQPDTAVWYQGEEQVLVLKRTGNSVQLLRTGMTDGAYDGVFDSWNCDGNTGDIIHEQGTFQAGIMTGDYTALVHTGSEAGDLYALWSNRESMEYHTYRGNFNEQGVTTLGQPTENNRKTFAADAQAADCVVYAYDESGENCLFMGLAEGEDASAYAFGAKQMGWNDYPVVEAYEVQTAEETETAPNGGVGENAADASQAADNDDAESEVPRVRIFDGEIQIYLGSAWVSLGTVQQYEREDPFRTYEDSRKDAAKEPAEEGGEEGQQTAENRRLSGTIQKETPKADTPKKPSGNKNNSSNKNNNPTPAPSQEPTQEQAPAQQPSQPQTPAQPSQPSQPQPSQPQPSQPQPSQPQPSQPEPSTPSGGADVDIEWTDDIL